MTGNSNGNGKNGSGDLPYIEDPAPSVPSGIEEDLEKYLSGIDTADILAARADTGPFDAVVKDPSLISAVDALDIGESDPPRKAIDDTRELLTWLATRYDGAIGGRLLLLMSRDIGRNEEALIAADEYFRYMPEVEPRRRFQQRAELAQRYRWLRGL